MTVTAAGDASEKSRREKLRRTEHIEGQHYKFNLRCRSNVKEEKTKTDLYTRV